MVSRQVGEPELLIDANRFFQNVERDDSEELRPEGQLGSFLLPHQGDAKREEKIRGNDSRMFSMDRTGFGVEAF
jgi:hypothetical protein